MSKGSSGTYYINNKERIQEKFRERCPSLFKEEKKIATIWLQTIQKSTRRCKGKPYYV